MAVVAEDDPIHSRELVVTRPILPHIAGSGGDFGETVRLWYVMPILEHIADSQSTPITRSQPLPSPRFERHSRLAVSVIYRRSKGDCY